ncbi:cation diffusion facilitator family transporter [Haloferula sp. A504]|uniref:cation diffusion facilitator family transporter n=1 Tax=Haloferula sp. A504 TaxID=3373601 RepID=UPI0031C1E394|nr:cation diffusion facilitator family transporter [Verrucomicrobiaceae bacterium E54]
MSGKMESRMEDHRPSIDERRVMNFSLVVAVVLLGVKVTAAILTGSAAIYSDAAESVTHVLAVGFAAWALRLSHKPSDDTHHFGHDKVAFFSAALEGAMISAAGVLIFYEAARQYRLGSPVEALDLGLWLTSAAAVVNTVLGLALLRVGRRRRSGLLEANGEHVLADVWTSVGVVLALLLVRWTGDGWWDPLFAGIAGGKLLWTGVRLMKRSFGGLMDKADLEVEASVRDLLDGECANRGFSYHNLRHRHSGRTHWVELHLVMPDGVGLREAHEAATEIEAGIAALLEPEGRVITHLEPRSAEDREENWEAR